MVFDDMRVESGNLYLKFNLTLTLMLLYLDVGSGGEDDGEGVLEGRNSVIVDSGKRKISAKDILSMTGAFAVLFRCNDS